MPENCFCRCIYVCDDNNRAISLVMHPRQLLQNSLYWASDDVQIAVGMKPCCEDIFDRYVEIIGRRDGVLLHHTDWTKFCRLHNYFLDFFKDTKSRQSISLSKDAKILFGTLFEEREIMLLSIDGNSSVFMNEKTYINLMEIRPVVDYHLQWLKPKIELIEKFSQSGNTLSKSGNDTKILFEASILMKKKKNNEIS